jgi:hypothetical protein
MTMIMGRGTKLKSARRCDYCQRAVKYGYFVKEGPTQGFFCGRAHFDRARKTMDALKKEKGIR